MVAGISWLRRLEEEEVELLVATAERKTYRRYANIARPHIADRYFHLLLFGRVQIFIPHLQEEQTHSAGSHFGEGAIVAGRDYWIESALALEDCVLLRWPVETFAKMRQRTHSSFADMHQLKTAMIALSLRQLFFFQDLQERARVGVANMLEYVCLPQGACAFAQGDLADRVFFIVSGRVGLYRSPPGGGESTLFLEFSGGDSRLASWFGLSAVFQGFSSRTMQNRNATAKVMEPAQLLTIHISQFGAFLQLLPGFQEMAAMQMGAYAKLDQLRAPLKMAQHGAQHHRPSNRPKPSPRLPRLPRLPTASPRPGAPLTDRPGLLGVARARRATMRGGDFAPGLTLASAYDKPSPRRSTLLITPSLIPVAAEL